MAKKSKTEKTEKKEINKETEVKKSKDTKGAGAVEATPLQNLAKDINKVLGVEPALDVSAKDLESQIKEIMPEIQSEDKLSKESFAMLKELGWGKKETKKVEKEKNAKKVEKNQKLTTKLGSRIGSQAEKIDVLLLEGKARTKEELAKDSKLSVARINVHLRHLMKKGIKIQTKDGKFQAKK